LDDDATARQARHALRLHVARARQRYAFAGHGAKQHAETAAAAGLSSSPLARLYSLPFLLEVFLLSTQLFPQFRPRAFAHAFGCKFFLAGLAHRDAKFREIANACMRPDVTGLFCVFLFFSFSSCFSLILQA
jgi:hypothetical protein